MGVPSLTYDERVAALGKAARVRAERAGIRQAVSRGSMPVSQVLALDGQAASGMRALDLVSAALGGRDAALGALAELGISERRRVAGLGHVQRAALFERFG